MAKAGESASTCRFPVYHMRINGQARGVVPPWRLYELLRQIKLLNIYPKISRLRDAGSLELSTWVHGRPVHVEVRAASWEVFSNPSRARPAWMSPGWQRR